VGRRFFYFDKPTNQLRPDLANYNYPDYLNRTCKVGSYKPNRLGLFDMHGNVWEWCEDADNAPDGAPGRVNRGGSCIAGNPRAGPDYCRAGFRHIVPASVRSRDTGLRVARVPADKPDK
jgi:formylglycine-generating enzyme required for sulfatase activity